MDGKVTLQARLLVSDDRGCLSLSLPGPSSCIQLPAHEAVSEAAGKTLGGPHRPEAWSPCEIPVLAPGHDLEGQGEGHSHRSSWIWVPRFESL